MIISKPLLASEANLDRIFPEDQNSHTGVFVSNKLDGIRALTINGKLLSRSFKPIPNVYIRTHIEAILPNNVDGELIVGNAFNESSSGIMSRDGEPDFTYHVFDYVSHSLLGCDEPFHNRLDKLKTLVKQINDPRIVLVPHEIVYCLDDLLQSEENALKQGFEGLMIRKYNGVYKCGRSSTREGILLKLKRFKDAEAKIVGFEELMHNSNDAKEDAFGRTKRSTKKEGLIPAGVLGKLIVQDLITGLEFGVGSGYDAKQRKSLWDARDTLSGKIITYKYQPAGVKDLPRFPVFKGFRHPEDM